jgi:DUF4097 and DUF4098 domain-containing protein YvlB
MKFLTLKTTSPALALACALAASCAFTSVCAADARAQATDDVRARTAGSVRVQTSNVARIASLVSSRQSSQSASQQSVASARDVTVTLCVEAGDVTVRGWDSAEVRATVAQGAHVELRRAEAEEGRSEAGRVEVLAFGEGGGAGGECGRGGGAITLDVPRGGFVQLKSYGGRIGVADVAGARVETLNGDVALSGLSQWVEAKTANGTISLRRSKGRARLSTISGQIDASDVSAVAAGDDFNARTTSGDISLARIGHTQVEAVTANGAIDLGGPLARGGSYTLRSQTGGVTVTLPADSSFALSATVYAGEIVTEFAIRQSARRAGESGGIINGGRLTGIAGKSDAPDAKLTLTSFNGSINLRKARLSNH